MAKEVLMPKLGMTMETGTIVQWFKEEGDHVESGEILLEVMTDKINIEVESYESGTLLKKYYHEDDVVPVNQVIAYIGEPGEKVPDQPPQRSEQAAKETETSQPTAESSNKEQPMRPTDKPRATPAARKLAREHDVNLMEVEGTGARGRIHREDVERFIEQRKQRQPEPAIAAPSATPVPSATPPKRTPLTGMRKLIGERMVQSVQEAPHVTLHSEIDMTQVVEVRKQLLPDIEAKTGYRLSYTEIIVKAVAVVLKDHPALQTSIEGDELVTHDEVNIGLAVSHPQGLIVPVIRQADRLGLAELTTICKQLAKDAREGRLSPDATSGGTFTISNLGMYAVDSFTPIINPPESAILGVGRIVEKPVGYNGEITLRSMMSVSLSFDHRVMDGVPAAAFLTQLKEVLENPYQLLI